MRRRTNRQRFEILGDLMAQKLLYQLSMKIDNEANKIRDSRLKQRMWIASGSLLHAGAYLQDRILYACRPWPKGEVPVETNRPPCRHGGF